MTASELAETLTVIADKAKALRDAGVVGRIEVANISFEIGEAFAPTGPMHEDAPGNPLDDKDTYGGFIPTRRVRHEEAPASTESDEDENDDD